VRAPAVLAALLLAACAGGSEDAATEADERGEPTVTTTTTTTTEPEAELDGYPLEVVDRGWSVFPDPIDPDDTLGGFGVVVENANPHVVASGATVSVRLLDGSGAELASDVILLNGVPPESRMAAGRTLIEPIDQPASMEVDVEVAAWIEPAPAGGGMIARDVATTPVDGGGMLTTFEVRSTMGSDEEGVDVAAVYRADDGRILGAEMTTLERVPGGGVASGEIALLAPIPDLDRTDLFVGRGFAALTTG
jgi:hypothetical protein